MRLLDNRTQGLVVDALRAALHQAARASLLTHELSLFALDALRSDLGRLAGPRLLLAPGCQPSRAGTDLPDGADA